MYKTQKQQNLNSNIEIHKFGIKTLNWNSEFEFKF